MGFRFVLCVSVLGLFFSIFVVAVVVLWFFCFYQPPYIFDSPLHLNPTTEEHFKTPSKISSQISNRSGKKKTPLTWNFAKQIFLQGLF